MRTMWGWVVAIAVLVVAGGVNAGDFDGSKALVCAPIEAFECEMKGCQRAHVEELNIPFLFRLDFKNKVVHGTRIGGERASTAIRTIEKGDGVTLIQGFEGGRGFSAIIDQTSGKLSLTASGAEAGFVVLGACVVD